MFIRKPPSYVLDLNGLNTVPVFQDNLICWGLCGHAWDGALKAILRPM